MALPPGGIHRKEAHVSFCDCSVPPSSLRAMTVGISLFKDDSRFIVRMDHVCLPITCPSTLSCSHLFGSWEHRCITPGRNMLSVIHSFSPGNLTSTVTVPEADFTHQKTAFRPSLASTFLGRCAGAQQTVTGNDASLSQMDVPPGGRHQTPGALW